jgi:hypothetical protein
MIHKTLSEAVEIQRTSTPTPSKQVPEMIWSVFFAFALFLAIGFLLAL